MARFVRGRSRVGFVFNAGQRHGSARSEADEARQSKPGPNPSHVRKSLIMKPMKENVHQDAKRRLARIAGQVAGIQKMVDEERYCVDILTQVAALRAALDQFGVLMLSSHLEDCVYGNEGGECNTMSPTERLEEIKVTLNRFLK